MCKGQLQTNYNFGDNSLVDIVHSNLFKKIQIKQVEIKQEHSDNNTAIDATSVVLKKPKVREECHFPGCKKVYSSIQACRLHYRKVHSKGRNFEDLSSKAISNQNNYRSNDVLNKREIKLVQPHEVKQLMQQNQLQQQQQQQQQQTMMSSPPLDLTMLDMDLFTNINMNKLIINNNNAFSNSNTVLNNSLNFSGALSPCSLSSPSISPSPISSPSFYSSPPLSTLSSPQLCSNYTVSKVQEEMDLSELLNLDLLMCKI